ncbi:MAG: hypothetical protein H0W85_04735 [Methylotenera sp.]|nr:hypothetical protein [Methylotenera sp.]
MFTDGRKLVGMLLALMPMMAQALEYRSVAVPKAVLYDAPSTAAKKILLLSQYYPVEVIVNLGDWLKVRDAKGSISWVESKQLIDKRMVIVIANAEIRKDADALSSVIANAEKNVVLEVLDTNPSNGWLKVKHRDGAIGYILISKTWGFN